MIRSLVVMLFASLFVIGLSLPAAAYTCGNGTVEAGEVCDWGSNNSDYAPNSCRNDCRMAYCGDSVIDNGEECDEGQYTVNNPQSTKCRSHCKLPKCGDGVVDKGTRVHMPKLTYNEECDDGNTSNEDGCLNSCKSCVPLATAGNIEITDDTNICSGTVKLDDYGDYGTIIIKKSGITLDCNGAKITGEGRGVGIMIFRSHNVTIKNCEVYGYEVGIKGEDSNNVILMNNRLCGNSIADFEFDEGTTQMNGSGNACGKAGNWNDTGKQGCSANIPICNPPSVGAQFNMQQVGASINPAILKNMPQVTVQKKAALVAPLSDNVKAMQIKPIQTQAAPKKINVAPKTRRLNVIPKE